MQVMSGVAVVVELPVFVLASTVVSAPFAFASAERPVWPSMMVHGLGSVAVTTG